MLRPLTFASHPDFVPNRERQWPGYAKRHAVTSGVLGWAKVPRAQSDPLRGAHSLTEYDLYDVKRASLRLDLRILGVAARSCILVGACFAIGRARAGAAAATSPARSVAAAMRRQWSRRPVLHRGGEERRPDPQATLLVGAGAGGMLLAKEMFQNRAWGFRPVAFVDDDSSKVGTRPHGIPVVGGTNDIPAVVQARGIEVVVVAIPSASETTVARIGELARQSTARVLTMPSIEALLRGTVTPGSLRRVPVTDVLGRPAVAPDIARCRSLIAGRRVLITGAAGSIGEELTHQVARLGPGRIVVLDTNESGLFDLQHDVALRVGDKVDVRPAVASVTNRRRVEAVFAQHRPEIVFHAAAYKHVPLMEDHPEEAVMVNVLGTDLVARAAAATGARRFVLVSTDKAVRPSSVMGATKRLAELAVKGVAAETGLSACSVRFGNVLGSRGSVIPTFERQIEAGGPVTVTDSRMTRFFMTVSEAGGLIIEAAALGDRQATYVLDMGEEVSILQLAERMIRLRGLRVGQDIQIVFTGLRPGEKLREELALGEEVAAPTQHPKIRLLTDHVGAVPHAASVGQGIERLATIVRDGSDPGELRVALFGIIDAADGGARDGEDVRIAGDGNGRALGEQPASIGEYDVAWLGVEGDVTSSAVSERS